MKKIVHVSGSRKKSIARATLREGKGIIRVNKQLLETLQPEFTRLKISEPLMIAGDLAKKVDIMVKVHGGGSQSQTEATRLAIARALVEFSKDKTLKKEFLEYDRTLLVPDVRQREAAKPNRHGKARSKRQKSYR